MGFCERHLRIAGAVFVCTAARVGAVGLCDMNNETIPDAETVLLKNLCPLIKGTYGFALSPIAICKSIARSCRPTTAASSI